MIVTHDDVTTVGTKEDWYPMGVILQSFGQKVSDFSDTNEALGAVRHLCAQNQQEHGYGEKPELLDDKFPQFSRFWFVMSLGKKQENKQNVKKQLEQHVDLKNLKQLEEAKVFMEGMGYKEGEPSSSSVQLENAKAMDLKKEVELLKSSYLG